MSSHRSYETVIYPHDIENCDFFIGDIDSSLQIESFSNITLEGVEGVDRHDMMYHVVVNWEGETFTLDVIQKYLVFCKLTQENPPLHSLVEAGIIDPVETGNKILATALRKAS
jgi:hypothetical protein